MANDYNLESNYPSEQESGTQTPHQVLHWTNPPLGTLKINVDGAARPLSAAVAIVCDSTGSVIQGGSVHLSPYSPEEIEVKALLIGLKLVVELPLGPIRIKGDNNKIVQLISDK